MYLFQDSVRDDEQKLLPAQYKKFGLGLIH